ncbi:uncharacterized protein LOC121882147 isoform X1 [Thunnus maccoyii]|uniref:uncharacterized protein LOC121882147 isoform X1 n=1 Tax=Thunnus maccoyii TaxID=8240 RepID=UPI001C4D03B6|nr:uncharacterized protein LOC121882147 isoform X1 [Thunnus maccoyii]
MVELRWIKMSLFLILGLQFTAVTGQTSLYITVRDGDEVTLSCENVMTDQDKCDRITWLFNGLRSTATVALIELGQIVENAKAKSDRLSVTANCSLVIKKVTVEDVGRYTCRQFKSGQEQGQDSRVDLSVVTSEDTKSAATTKSTTTTSTKTTKLRTTTSTPKQDFPDWAKFIIVAVGLASLLIIVLVIIRWKKTKGKKTQMDENIGLSLNPAVTPETSQDTADPEDGVSYVSISFTGKTNSKARVGGDGDDEGDAVTYSTVKASSSSAGASTDPSSLYATINKPNK